MHQDYEAHVECATSTVFIPKKHVLPYRIRWFLKLELILLTTVLMTLQRYSFSLIGFVKMNTHHFQPISIVRSAATTSTQGRRPPGMVLLDANESEDAGLLGIDSLPDPSARKAGLGSLTNSATLLRQLLLLRKQRQAKMQVEPPPDCVGGSKVTSMKVISAAAGLRAKFLRARALERRARLVQREDMLREKVMAKLMKAEAKKRALRGEAPGGNQSSDEASTHRERRDHTDLDAKATLLANFFKEMSIYHPTQKELDEAQCAAPAAAQQEDELLEHFADLFDDDHALQNILDTEKWLTADEKTKRRRSIVEDRRQRRRESLVLLRSSEGVSNTAAGDGTARASTCTQPQRASEDYVNTAMLIQQLMREVEDEERGLSAPRDESKRTETDVARLAESWEYAARWNKGPPTRRRPHTASFCASPSVRSREFENDEKIGEMLQDLEGERRQQWMESHCIQDAGMHEKLVQNHGALRPPLVPTTQEFHEQEKYLPWQPMWEVSADHAVGGSSTIGSVQQTQPRTAAVTPFSPRRPITPSPAACAPSVPLKSATLARLHTHRIRSAGHGDRLVPHNHDEDTTTALPNRAATSAAHRSSMCGAIPRAFIVDGPLDLEIDGHGTCPATLPSPHQDPPVVSTANLSHQTGEATSISSASCDPHETLSAALAEPPVQPKKTVVRKKKWKKLTPEEKRFTQRVQELLSITPFTNQLS